MADVFFDNPPVQSGTPQQYLQTLYGYLHRMSDQLNQALQSLNTEQLAQEVQTRIQTMTVMDDSSAADKADLQKTADTLRNLIIKNADEVKKYSDEIKRQLNGDIEIISKDFGTLRENITSEIEESAFGIIRKFNIESTLNAQDERIGEFIRNINTYIYSGLLDNGETGIAIGENITDPTDGHLVSDNQTATFTKNRLSFYVNGAEVAYFAQNKFNINEGIIRTTLQMGNHVWKVLSNGAIALMKA